MREFVRSFAERVIWLDDGNSRTRHLVRQPTVREALALLTAISGAVSNDSEEDQEKEREYFFDVLEGWIPLEVYDLWSSSDYPFGRVVASVFALINEGVPDFRAHRERLNLIYGKTDDSEEEQEPVTTDELSATASLPWERYVSDYMYAYKLTVEQVLAEPWNAFLNVLESLLDPPGQGTSQE